MPPELSIVIPVRNESPNIKALYDELTATLGARRPALRGDRHRRRQHRRHLRASWPPLQARDPRLRVIRFRRNFGQTAAFAAGFAYARGRLVVTTDGDLQNDPADIPRMVRSPIDEGYDIVCGWRKDRKDTFVTRRVPSMLANRLISWATGVAAARLRLLAEGVPRRGRQAAAALRRDAPLPAGDRQRDRRAHRRGRREPPAATRGHVEVRPVAHRSASSSIWSPSSSCSATRRGRCRSSGWSGLAAGGLGALITAYLGYVRLVLHQAIADRPLLLLGMLLVFIGVQLADVRPARGAAWRARTTSRRTSRSTSIREIRQTPRAWPSRGRAAWRPLDGAQRRARTTRASPSSSASCSTSGKSKADKYRDLVIGRPGWGPLLAFELVTLFSVVGAGRARPVPALEAVSADPRPRRPQRRLRRQRHAPPSRTRSSSPTTSSSTISCCLDAKGTDNRGIDIGSGVFVGRNTILSCKNGDIVDRRPGQPRLQLRDLLGVARARRARAC